MSHILNHLQMESLLDGREFAASPRRNQAGKKPTGNRAHGMARALAIAGVAIAAGVVAWQWHGASASPSAIAELPSVTVSAPVQRDLETRLGFLGQFAAVEHVEIRAQVGGILTKIHFKDGDVVREGDLLFTVDPTPYEIKLSQAHAQLENAEARLELANQQLVRARMLRKSDTGTAESVDQRASDQRAAQAVLNEAKAFVRDAQFDLDHTTITAPFSGRISTHLVSVGNLISGSRAGSGPTTLLTTLVSLDPLYLNFDMSEADYLAFKRQQAKEKEAPARRVAISLSDENSYAREGTLTFIDNALDRSSGTIHARATIPNPDLLLTPGAFGRVRVALSERKATLLVPDASVLPDQSNHTVLTVGADGLVQAKLVQVGELRGGLRVIRSGLEASDRVVIDGIPTTLPGSKVHPAAGEITYKNDQD